MRQLEQRGVSFAEHLSGIAEQFRLEAAKRPPGPEREALLAKVRSAEIAIDIDQWACSPGLQPTR